MSHRLRRLFRGVVSGCLIGAWLPARCLAADQFTKLADALGPDFRPSLNEAQGPYDTALKLKFDGEYVQAAALLERALQIVETNTAAGSRDQPLLLTSLAEAYLGQGNFTNAEDCLRRGLDIGQARLGNENPIIAGLLMAQASLKQTQGNLDEALSLRRGGLSMFEKAYGNEHLTVGLCLCEIGLIFLNQYKLSEALAALERSRSIVERCLGAEHFLVSEVLANISSVYREQGDYKRALAFLEHSLSIREKEFGSDHLLVSECLYGIALVHSYQEDYVGAERFFKRALGIIENRLGKDHRHVAICLDKLVEVYRARGEYTEALRLNARSFEIEMRVYGTNHPLTANSFETHGEIQQALGNHEAAWNAFFTCMKIRFDTLGPKHLAFANAAEHLASAALAMRNYTNALTYFEVTLKLREEALGMEHPHVAVSLARLADFWYQFGQTLTNANAQKHVISKSVELQEQSIGILEKALGADAPDVSRAKEYLAAMLLAQGEIRWAVITGDEALAGKRKQLVGQLAAASEAVAFGAMQRSFASTEIFYSLCALAAEKNLGVGVTLAARQLALNKALLEEVESAQTALDRDPRTATRELQDRYQIVLHEMTRLSEVLFDQVARDARRRELQSELSQLGNKLADRGGLVAQTIRERNLTLTDIARSLPPQSALADFIQYRRLDFAANTNAWKEQRYAAYLTFPLARDSTNVVVERVDLGEAAPINEAVELVCKRMSAGQFAAKDLSPALQRLSQLIYAPLAPHLKNVSHMIVCPDGQLSRLPFEMLPVGNKFLVEEKTISYVTSGREVVRIANAKLKIQNEKSLVMGNPDFDLDLG
jgi:tetratricopeptide (TPR) repeat protein